MYELILNGRKICIMQHVPEECSDGQDRDLY